MKDINKGSLQVHHRTLQRRLWRIIKQKDTAKDNEDDLLFPYPHNDEVIVDIKIQQERSMMTKIKQERTMMTKIYSSLIHTMMKK